MKKTVLEKKNILVVVALFCFLAMAGTTWATSVNDGFDPGTNSAVYSIAIQADGKIVVGGMFTTIDGQTRNYIARLHGSGSVDASFNPPANSSVESIAIQADGKIVVGGFFTTIGGQTRNYIARLHADGSVDAGFNPNANDYVRSIAIQADGKILLGGNFTTIGGQARNYIARLNVDGSVDAGFNPGANSYIRSIAIQADGKIVVGGNFGTIGGQARNYIARLHGSGTVDTVFNPNADSYVYAIAIQADGKIVVGGNFSTIGGQTRDRIARLHGSGSVDASFNPGGNSTVYSIAIQADGKIVVGGMFTTIGGQARNRIARLHGSGTVDAGFNPGANDYVCSIAIQADGKIVVGGNFTTIGGQARNRIARLHGSGSVDAVFIPGANGYVYSIALQADGKIVVGGNFTTIGGQTRNYIARLHGSGSMDASFDPGANSYIYSIALQADGKIVVGGNFTTIGGQARNRIARLHADGTVDAGFNPGADNSVLSIDLQADGKILVGGTFTQINGQTRNRIARLNGDGSLDTGFDPGANGSVGSIALQADGKILLGGGFTQIGGQTRNRIARLNGDGSLDTGFNPGANASVNSIAIQADGKIVVGGAFTQIGGQTRNRITRLHGDSSVDTDFNPGVNDWIYSIAIQADGKIVVGGYFTTIGGQTRNRIARLHADGSVDAGLNPDVNSAVYSIALQADGKILLGGIFIQIDGQTRNYIARLSADESALQNLAVAADGTAVTWSRGQSSPEIHDVTFEYSDDLATWTPLGAGTRISGGWQLTGQSLPYDVNGYVRGRGQVLGGMFNASTSQLESVLLYYLPLSITVTSPNGGETWTVGDSHDITWTSEGNVVNVNIDYSTNSGGNWTSVVIETANDGTYNWTVPSAPSTTCLVRIRDAVDNDPSDSSDAVFTIAAAVTETVSAPDEPTGPNTGTIATSYAYTSGGSTSSLGHSVQYKFDWDDGSDSGWLAVGTTEASHSWAAAGTYNIKAMARCAEHTTVESLWSTTIAVIIYDGGGSTGNYNSPAQYKVLPEVIWASATGGGTWMSNVQVTDVSGGSQVSVFYNTVSGRRGPFLLWDNTAGAALSSQKYANLLETIDGLDSGTFSYYGTVGAVEFISQDGSHLLQAAARTLNGYYAKTFTALSLHDANTADTSHGMVIPNLSNNSTYRSSCGFFNPTADAVTVELYLRDAANAQVGSKVSKSLSGYGFLAFNPFIQAGIPYPGTSCDNIILQVQVTSGTGKVVCFGASANNTTNDPAAHIAVQSSAVYDNGPNWFQVLPEVIWAAATGGGTWISEVQIVDVSGGSQVEFYFDYGGGNSRGPFVLWTGGGAGSKVKYANILQKLGTIDTGFSYYGRVGTLCLYTLNSTDSIQVTARTLNGNYSKTFPGLNRVDAEMADISRAMLIQNFTNNAGYRSTCGFFNPRTDAVTVEFTLLDGSGAQIGNQFSKTLAGYDFQAFNPFIQAGVSYPGNSYDNVILRIRPTSGTGQVMCFGASADNTSNDPASHLAVQGQ